MSTLPITAMLEEIKNNLLWAYTYPVKEMMFIDKVIPQVRTLEEAQQWKLTYLEETTYAIEKEWYESLNKAKEEERERIVGILEEIKNDDKKERDMTYQIIRRQALQEAIERISNNK